MVTMTIVQANVISNIFLGHKLHSYKIWLLVLCMIIIGIMWVVVAPIMLFCGFYALEWLDHDRGDVL